MAREFKRSDRVAEQLQRELAQIIQLELEDPRLGMVTVCSVDISRDLHYATAYVTFLALEESAYEEAIKILNGAAGTVRTMLGKRMRMRTLPQLKFVFDESISRGRELSSLINQAVKKDAEAAEQNPDSDPANGE